MTTIDFAHPEWLAIAAAACVLLVALMVRSERRRRAALHAFAAASPISSLSRGRRWARNALVLVGVAMACIALARPRSGYTWEQTPRQGIDLVFAVDTSKSMRAADLRPDRLTRAKLAVADLVRDFDGDRVGLVAFAGNAFVQAPMTADRGVFLDALAALDTDIIPRGGSDLSAGIRAAREAVASAPNNRKLLVLLSDGEDLAGAAVDAARDAARDGMTIYTVGVGSQRGELIQVAGPNGRPELVRDANGEPVRSRLDETTLRAIAQVTGGAYRPLGADGRGLEALYATELSNLPQASTITKRKVYSERFQIPLAIALACLLLELVMRERRRAARGSYAAASALPMLALLVAVPWSADAAPRGKPGVVGSYNAGTETYRGGDYARAQEQFEAALRTRDIDLQVDAYYNLGNARYRAGEQALERDRAQAIAAWKRALEAYDAALALDADDADARFNRDVVARKLAALEREQQQQQGQQGQQQQAQQGQQQGQQDQQQQGQQGQQQQGQQQQGQQGAQQGQQGQQQQGQQQQAQQGQQQQNGQQGQQGQQQRGQQGQQQRGQQDQQQQGQQGQQQRGQQGQQQRGQQGQQQQGQQGQQQQGQQDQQQQGQQGQQQQGQQGQQQQGQQGQQQQRQQQQGARAGESARGSDSRADKPDVDAQGRDNRDVDSRDAGRDKRDIDPRNPGRDKRDIDPRNAGRDNRDVDARDPARDKRDVDARDPARDKRDVDARDPARDKRDVDSRDPGRDKRAAARGGQAGDRAAADREAEAAARADAARRAAGQLTRREALQLLQSVEDELHPLPFTGTGDQPTDDEPIKDW